MPAFLHEPKARKTLESTARRMSHELTARRMSHEPTARRSTPKLPLADRGRCRLVG